MRNGVGHLPDPDHQMLDPVEHAVNIAAQPGELVLPPRDRDTTTQVTDLDRPRRPADGPDAALDLPPEQEGAAEGEPTRDRPAHREGVPDHLFERVHILY